MQTIWLSPTDYVTGDPTLQISYPSVAHPGTIVTCSTPGDLKWISMGLRLPSNVSLEEVRVCYQVSNPQSFIAQVRLTGMGTPEQAVVMHDDGADLQSTTPVCYSSNVGGKAPSPGTAVTLMLRLNFQNTTDQIMLGAVGVTIEPLAECVATIAALKVLSAGVVPCLTVLGYHAPGDGGGGNFYWDASATELDNGGTIIAPASSPPTGRWKRLVDGPLSVRWFGAVPSDTIPSTAAFEAATRALVSIASSNSKLAGVLYVPKGTYVANIDWSRPTLEGLAGGAVITYARLTLRGDGEGSLNGAGGTLIIRDKTADANVPVLNLASVSGYTIENIGFDCRTTVQAGQVCVFAGRLSGLAGGGAGHTFRHVRVHGTPSIAGYYCAGAEGSVYDQCVFQTGGPAPCTYVTDGSEVLLAYAPNGQPIETTSSNSEALTIFRSCYFNMVTDLYDTAPSGANVRFAGRTSLHRFENCYFPTSTDNARAVQFTGGFAYNITFDTCLWETPQLTGSKLPAVAIYSAPGTIVDGLLIYNCTFNQQRGDSAPDTIPLEGQSVNVRIFSAKVGSAAFGTGIRFNDLVASAIQWPGNYAPLKEAVSAGEDTCKTESLESLANLLPGVDRVLVGNQTEPPEIVTVGSFTLNSIGLQTGSSFARAHKSGASIYIGTITVVSGSGNYFESPMPPVLTTVKHGNGWRQSGRELYGGVVGGAQLNIQAHGTSQSAYTPIPAASGFLALSTAAASALFYIDAVAAATYIVADPKSKFSIIEDNTLTFNVFFKNGELQLQNRSGASARFVFSTIAALT